MTTLRVQIPEKLGEIFTGEADYRGAYGGRGAAKTLGFASMAILEMMSLYEGKPWRFLCGRELQKSLKDSVHSVLSSRITEMGLDDLFEVGREFIRHKNGNEFLFYGLRTNIAEIKSLHGVRRTWLEEAQKVSQSSLDYLIPTVMRDFHDCEIWASWNPQDEDDPIQELFVKNADERTKCVKINYYDNPWFPDSLDRVRLRDKEHNPDKYGWIWEGNFNVNNESSVYGKWVERARQEGRIKRGIYDPALPVFTAWDLGYSDDTAIWWFQVSGNEVRLIDFYATHREDILHYAEQIYGREIVDIVYGPSGKVMSFNLGAITNQRRASFTYADHYVPHDAANKLLQAGGRSVVDQLYELGIKAKVVPATSQQNQIDGARKTLGFSWFDEEYCAEGLKCLKKYEYDEKDDGTFSHVPIHSGWSHGCDAYEVIAQIWKTAKIDEPPPKPRFLNEATLDELWASTPRQKGGRI